LFATGAAIAGLLVALPALVERLAVSELAAVGVTGAALTVRRIGLDGAEITDIRLGPDGAATIARLRVAYSPRDLYARRLDEIEIAGVRLRGRIDADGATIAGLEGLATMGAGGAGTALPVKRIRIDDLRVALKTPLGGLSINADGTVAPNAGGGLDIAATVALVGDPGSVSGNLTMTRAANGRITGRATIAEATLGWPPVAIGGLSGDLSFVVDGGGAPQSLTARLTAASVETPEGPISAATLALDYDGRNLNASARGSALGGALDGSFTLVARDLTTPKPRLASDGALTWRDGAALAGALPGLDPGVGAVSWSLAGTPPADLAALADTTPRAWLQNLATAGTITVETKGLALAEMATGVGIRGTVGVEISHGVIALDDAGGVTVSGRPARAIVARLPVAFMPLATGDVAATIGGDGRSPLLIELRPDGDGWAVRAATGADVRAVGGTRLALDLVGDATLDAGGAVTRFDLQSLDLDLRASPPEAAGLAARLRATISGTPRDMAGVFDADLGAARLRTRGVRAEAPHLVVSGRLAIAEGKPRLTLDRDGRLDVAALAGAGATTGPLTIAINAGKRPLLAVEGGAFRYALDLALPETTVTLTSDGAPPAAWSSGSRAWAVKRAEPPSNCTAARMNSERPTSSRSRCAERSSEKTVISKTPEVSESLTKA